MLEGEVEHTRVPRIPLDVLCQQIVAMASVEELHIDELHALVKRAYPYRELTREQLENVLDLLAGRYPSDEFAELRPRIVWERTTGSLRAREGAQRIAIANAGTIPDRGLYGVFLVDGGGRVGELDEEMVHEAREGQVFLLGASAWRIEQIERDRVIVSPAPGQPAQVPFWKGEQAGRPLELGRAVGRLQRELAALDDESAVQRLMGLHACDERAARTLVEYLREQELATGVLPSDRTIVVERFRDEIGDWRLCILSPFGAKVHAPWGLALRALLREQHGIETHALWSDDGIILHLPDADSLPPDELVAIDPERIEDLVVGELGGSSLFGARFRESAARALLIPRRRPGQRTPLWQQRLRAQSLLAVAERYGSFPILLETYRELLADHFDLGALRELLAGLRDGSRQLVAVESQTASPFAASLNFEYVAQYLYEDDAPAAERRVAALTLDRDLLRELAGSDELRDLLDADALEQVELELGGERRGGADALHDLLRRVGDLAEGELATRLPGDAAEAVAGLLGDRRAVRLRIGGEDRLIAAEDIGRYRDALGTMPPGGMPAAFLEPVPDALRSLVARFARWRGPFPTRHLAERYDLEPAVAERELAALERAGTLVHGALRPGGSGSEWCDVEVLRRIRRASVARLRREVEAVEQPALARFSLSWHGAGRKGKGGVDRLREVLFPLQRLPLAPEVWERQVLPLRMDYRPELLDQLCTSGELVWLGADAGRVAIAFREDAALLGPPPGQAPPPADPAAEAVRAALQGARHLSELGSDTGLPEAEIIEALWRLVASGEVTNDAWEPLRRARRAVTPRTLTPRGGTRRLTRRRPAPRGAALGPLGTDGAAAECPDRRVGPQARTRGAAARAPRRARPRRRRRRGRARRAGRSAARARGARDARRLAARLPRRRARRRTARPAGRDRALARGARPGNRCAGNRAGRERSGESLRRRPALAGARGRPCLARGRCHRRPAQRRAARVPRTRSAHAALPAAARALRLGRGRPGARDGVARRTRRGAAARAHRRRAGRGLGRRHGVHRRRIRRRAEAPHAPREALTLPEGHTLEVAALRMAPLVGHRVAATGPGYQSPFGLAVAVDGQVLDVRRSARQAPARRVRQWPHPPLPPAHDRGVARLSRRAAMGALGAERVADARGERDRGGPVRRPGARIARSRARRPPPRPAQPRTRPARRRPEDRRRRPACTRPDARHAADRRGAARPDGSRRASATSCAARRCMPSASTPGPRSAAFPTRR